MTGFYSFYDDFFKEHPEYRKEAASKGGKTRAQTARRVHGKFAPSDPGQPFEIDHDSHSRGGKTSGHRRKIEVQVFGLRDKKGRFIKDE